MSTRLLIDGFNILHSILLKGRERARWWSSENQQNVLELVARFESPEDGKRFVPGSKFDICLVFDASSPQSQRIELPPEFVGLVRLHYAPNADDWIVTEAQSSREGNVVVVSADRALLDRAAHFGAARMSPWDFAQNCTKKQSYPRY